MSSVLKPPAGMTVAEFLAWDAPGPDRWQLVDGEPVAMAPASRTHGTLQGEFGRLIGNHLTAPGNNCTLVTAPGIVPRVRTNENFRIPDLAVTCTRYDTEEYDVSEPVLIVEILSPSNAHDTRGAVLRYMTIPSAHEILVLHSVEIRAELLRRSPDPPWPQMTLASDDTVTLESIGFSAPLASFYRTATAA